MKPRYSRLNLGTVKTMTGPKCGGLMKVNFMIIACYMCCCQLLPAVPRTKDQKITGLSIAKRFKALNMLIIYRKKKRVRSVDWLRVKKWKLFCFSIWYLPKWNNTQHPLLLMTSLHAPQICSMAFHLSNLARFRAFIYK